MSFLVDLYLPALLISAVAIAALGILQESPVRLRASLALIGLLAWFLPWQLVTLPVISQPALPLKHLIDATMPVFATGAVTALPFRPATVVQTAAGPGAWWWLFVPGALLFVFDLQLRFRQLRNLQRQSRDGESLRALLPESLQQVPGCIRIIAGANALATGTRGGTIWVGEKLCSHRELQAALVHECCHLQRKDAVLVLVINLARRLYCWNPLVLWLSRDLLLLLEQACDADAAAVLGRTSYLRSLAILMLDTNAGASGMALVPMAFGGSNNYRRIRALESGPASLLRRCTAGLMVLATCALAVNVNAEQRDPRIGEWRQDRSSPNLQGLYRIFEDLGNGITRIHSAANLDAVNQRYVDQRCNDGKFHQWVNANGVPTGRSSNCSILDDHTVLLKTSTDKEPGWISLETTETISSDGLHYTLQDRELNRQGEVTGTWEQTFTRNREACINADWKLQRQCMDRTRPPR